MEGQYIGSVVGDSPGAICVDIDRVGAFLTGSATFVPKNHLLPGTCAKFPRFRIEPKISFSCPILPIQRDGREIPNSELQNSFPDTQHANIAEVEMNFVEGGLNFSYSTDIGVKGSGTLTISAADTPSDLEVDQKVQSWSEFKNLMTNSNLDGWIFRGQSTQHRLRTSFHRTNRKDLVRYVDEDIPELTRHFSDKEGSRFETAEDIGAFLNRLQHHGYPTPILDWTSSPWVAAFFAFRSPTEGSSDKTRIFLFNFERWEADMPQFPFVSRVPIHLSHLRLGAARNRRAGPQMAKTLLTNVDDIEGYIQWHEMQRDRVYLLAVDLPHSERPQVLSDLQRMNISPNILFPDSEDAVCESLRNLRFYTR